MHADWNALYDELRDCQKCELCKARHTVVPGEGNPRAAVMLVGEGPGRDEDLSGRPFVGAAGQLLDKMLAAIGLKREDVYIANIVKCRPPQNRAPMEHEAEACLPYLRAQFALIRPSVIVCLGATAARYLYDPQVRITRDRGKWACKKGVWILPTYHPAALLRDVGKKKEAWLDMQALRDKLNSLKGEG